MISEFFRFLQAGGGGDYQAFSTSSSSSSSLIRSFLGNESFLGSLWSLGVLLGGGGGGAEQEGEGWRGGEPLSRIEDYRGSGSHSLTSIGEEFERRGEEDTEGDEERRRGQNEIEERRNTRSPNVFSSPLFLLSLATSVRRRYEIRFEEKERTPLSFFFDSPVLVSLWREQSRTP